MNKLFKIIKEASSWDDIHKSLMIFNVQDDKSAGRLFEKFCKYYYLAVPSVKNDYKNVWLFDEVPYEIKLKLGLGQVDHGVDLVLEGQDGSLAVVQCKFKNDQSSKISWSKDRLSNLFAEGTKSDYLIVFTNAAGIDKHSETKERLSIVTMGDLIALDEATIQQIKSLAKGNPIKPFEFKKPRDYQNEAIENVLKGFKDNDRGQLILPCGAGKTLISLWIREALNAKHTLVLVPSLALLKQIKDEWTGNSTYIPRICVCSERDIDRNSDTTVSRVYEIGGMVTTNPHEILSFLNSTDKSVVYSTYQSLERISDAVRGTGFQFDLVICDEAHKTAGSKLSKYGLIHDDLHIQVKKRLYMTATPRVISPVIKSDLTKESFEYIHDMSNSGVFGHEFHRMSFKEAIDKGILVDYKIVAIGVNNQEMQNALIERKYVTDKNTIDEIANNYAINKFMNVHKATHAITFHSTVKKAKEFRERHIEYYGEIRSFHVNGSQSTNERKVIMSEFIKSHKSIVTNSRCLTEGVDLPAIDAVYFCDPKNSKVDIVQAVGRVLRRADYKDKKFGYVIVPIYHRLDENVESVIGQSAFKNLICIIRALSSHDERITDEIKNIKIGYGAFSDMSSHSVIHEPLKLIMLDGFEKALEKSLFSQIISGIPLPFRKFEKARDFARSLGLTCKREWFLYVKSGNKPKDISSEPRDTYARSGWLGWGDWLGTGTVATFEREYREFGLAKKFVQSLQLESERAWRIYAKSGKKPEDIPASPDKVYKNKGWRSMKDWLGIYRSFEDAREFVIQLNIGNGNEWAQYCTSGDKPKDIPSSPAKVYKDNGWISLGDWLGTGRISNKQRAYLTFESARDFARSLELSNKLQWLEYCKNETRREDIPVNPDVSYKNDGWVSYSDWLGTKNISKNGNTFAGFEEAREFVRSLGFPSVAAWTAYKQGGLLPKNIPANPNNVYKNSGWEGYGDWLGTGTLATFRRKYRDFNLAREFVRSLELSNYDDWRQYRKSGDKPKDIPSTPNVVYKNCGWVGYGDWLGTGVVASQCKAFRSFESAKEFVRSLTLKNKQDWKLYSKTEKKPRDIPVHPNIVYKEKGWVSWSDWLGTRIG